MGGKKTKKDPVVDEPKKVDLSDILKEAETAKYCRNCIFAYLREETGCGYCKYTRKGKPIGFPQAITEYYTCKHWKKIKDK